MGIIVRNGISYGGTGTVDPILDQQSSNPVENKAVAKAIADINTALGTKMNTSDVQVLSESEFEALVTKTAPFYAIYADDE
jgi:hypothetical protein